MRCPRAPKPSAKTALAAGRNGGNASDVTNRMSSFSSERLLSSALAMGDAQRCCAAGSSVGRQRELIDDGRFEACEPAFTDALAMQVTQQARVAVDGCEPAQRGQQPLAVGRELVVIDHGDALAEPLPELQRLPNAGDVRRAGLLE